MIRKKAIITGSSTGLGESLAIAFATNGYDLVIHGRNKDKLEKVSERIKALGVACSQVLGDLMLSKTINLLELEALRGGGSSVLVNNAADILSAYGVPFEDIDDTKIDKILTTNLVSLIKLSRRIYKSFTRMGGGTIINMNSIVGLEFKETNILYGTTKWGLRGFTNSLALEARKKNIRVKGVYLTRVKTREEFTYGMDPDEVAQKIYEFYIGSNETELVLDGRPEEFKTNKYT
ncbi:MAG: short-chain dehydrogenase [Parcubacteria group bacterium Gr01-1014_20]|nr:MAG: short-chain dehydrogenase [Parcubacteria group bacterium Gr01-1014_20]